MRCSKCGRENRAGRRFCAHCGAKLTLVCTSCKAENEPGEQFCGDCGQRIAEPSHPPPSPPDPRSYTPKHLAEKILTSRSALEGERKQVTVLFADVKGSMDLAEQVDPEEWHQILDRFFNILTDGVHRFEGTVNQYTGDGIMALFGAPVAHEDHAPRACLAALHLQDTLRAYGEELRRTRGVSFSARMGLNSGEVIVGTIGDDLRMDYTAQGHTVGLAQRMEQLAEPGVPYVTAHTARLVEGYVRLRSLGEFSIKGAKEALAVYALEGLGPLRTPFEVSRARGLSKFVGREAEMQQLEAALERATHDRGEVIGVVAAAGTGKSRLCFEFLERCRARGIPVREAHCVSHGRLVRYLPILELLRTYFGITEGDGEREARQKIAGALLLLDRYLEPALPMFFDFLGVPAAEGFEYPVDEERFRILLAELSGDTAGTLERGRRAMATIEGYTGVHQTQSIQRVAALEALACANFLNACWQPCAEAAREALAIAAPFSVGNWIALPLLAQLAEAELGLGEIEAARHTADEAVARMRKHEMRGRETRALLARARVLLASEGVSGATRIRRDLDDALALCDRNGTPAWEPLIREEAARLHALCGESHRAAQEQRAAFELYTKLGATGHAARLRGELAS